MTPWHASSVPRILVSDRWTSIDGPQSDIAYPVRRSEWVRAECMRTSGLIRRLTWTDVCLGGRDANVWSAVRASHCVLLHFLLRACHNVYEHSDVSNLRRIQRGQRLWHMLTNGGGGTYDAAHVTFYGSLFLAKGASEHLVASNVRRRRKPNISGPNISVSGRHLTLLGVGRAFAITQSAMPTAKQAMLTADLGDIVR